MEVTHPRSQALKPVVPKASKCTGLFHQGRIGRQKEYVPRSITVKKQSKPARTQLWLFPAPRPAQVALCSNSLGSLGNSLNIKNQVNSIIPEESLRNISGSGILTNKIVCPF